MARGETVAIVDGRKVCTKCGTAKELSEFGLDKRGAGGRSAWCKRCSSAATLARLRAKKTTQTHTPQKATLAQPCQHVRSCGDAAIEKDIPGYFNTHPHAPAGQELQVCRKCGDIKTVRVSTRDVNDLAVEEVIANSRVKERPFREALRVEIAPVNKEVEEVVSNNGTGTIEELVAQVRQDLAESPVEQVVSPEGPIELVPTEPQDVDELVVKYRDALEVIKHQQGVIDGYSARLEHTLKQLVAANRRARLAEIELEIWKLEQEKMMLKESVVN